jgi:hypothetical protein
LILSSRKKSQLVAQFVYDRKLAEPPAEQAAEKVSLVVIPSEARDLLLLKS